MWEPFAEVATEKVCRLEDNAQKRTREHVKGPKRRRVVAVKKKNKVFLLIGKQSLFFC